MDYLLAKIKPHNWSLTSFYAWPVVVLPETEVLGIYDDGESINAKGKSTFIEVASSNYPPPHLGPFNDE